MPILQNESRIQSIESFGDLKPVLLEMMKAINIAFDKRTFTGDVTIENGKLVQRRGGLGSNAGDGYRVALTPTGQGSTTTEWEDRGK